MLTIWAVNSEGKKKVWLHVYNKYEARDLCEFNNWRFVDKEGEWTLIFNPNQLGGYD